ncbi:carnitinyl-CoA dehydratase [Mycobacterium avium subsp. avium 2285 (R)]|nr:carnitinyl-CoA dehydratase [Mycobacterium avium subsp. avium 2285 (R)]
MNGTALGGGAELALSCDLIVADESATFGLPEVKRGLIAGAGGVFRLVEQMPRKVALEVIFTGDPITAPDALRWGLINRVSSNGGALATAIELAGRITDNAPLSVRASKRIAYGVDHGVVAGEDVHWSRTEAEFTALLRSEDAQEGPRAFAEKRPAIWKGR